MALFTLLVVCLSQNTLLPLRQIRDIGQVYALRLAKSGVKTFDDVLKRGGIDLDGIVGKGRGQSLQQQVRQAVDSRVTIETVEAPKPAAGSSSIDVIVHLRRHGPSGGGLPTSQLTVWMETPTPGRAPLLLSRSLSKFPGSEPRFTCSVPRDVRKICVSILSEWIGLDDFDVFHFRAGQLCSRDSVGGSPTDSKAAKAVTASAPKKKQSTIMEAMASATPIHKLKSLDSSGTPHPGTGTSSAPLISPNSANQINLRACAPVSGGGSVTAAVSAKAPPLPNRGNDSSMECTPPMYSANEPPGSIHPSTKQIEEHPPTSNGFSRVPQPENEVRHQPSERAPESKSESTTSKPVPPRRLSIGEADAGRSRLLQPRAVSDSRSQRP